MTLDLSTEGSANGPQQRAAHAMWCDTARGAGIDTSGLNLEASLADRIAWALSCGLIIGTVLSRFSTKMQHGTESQIEDCLRFAAMTRIYVPPELLCVDEGVSGRRRRRAGLNRVKQILGRKLATVLLVFK